MRRQKANVMGFRAEPQSKAERQKDILRGVNPEDLLKFGLIPEFIGRLPVLASLQELDERALVQILTEPKNAITKQYARLFEMENVKLKFTDDAVRAVAKQALKRKVGARGLRAILEEVMLELMYEVPSQPDIKEVVISEDTIVRREQPIVVYAHKAETA